MYRMVLLLAALAWAAVAAAAVTVRVQDTPGGPQIHLDGRAIPPRFFFGSMNSGVVQAKPEWQDVSFDLRPGIAVDKTGTMHLRFLQVPGEVWIADMRIRDGQTGEDVLPTGSFATAEGLARNWTTWPAGEDNTVSKWEVSDEALHVTLTDPPGEANWPDFHFHSRSGLNFAADRTYRCTFRVKATPEQELRPALYNVTGGAWNYIGGPTGSFLTQIALARDAGVDLVSFSAPACWNPPDEPQDWEALDHLCRQIIAVNPRVLLVPRIGANAPRWWLERHPEAAMVFDGDKVSDTHASVSDRTYRAEVCAHLEKLCRHLSEAFPDHFAGVHPCGQNTGEWFYERSWSSQVSGYDPATLQAFREWLEARGDPQADTADVARRRGAPGTPQRPAARPGDRAAPDRLRPFPAAGDGDFVTEMAAACRRGTGGQKLVVFFYGYLFEFAPLQSGAPTSGHYALSTVLKSKDIDILCSPISYIDRDWLGTAPCMTAAESVRRQASCGSMRTIPVPSWTRASRSTCRRAGWWTCCRRNR